MGGDHQEAAQEKGALYKSAVYIALELVGRYKLGLNSFEVI